MNPTLTKKQRHILDYIGLFLRKRGYSPSYREIAQHFKLSSVATVHQHVQTLQSKGYLQPEKPGARQHRRLEPTTAQDLRASIVDIPLVGLITAGQPIEALQEHETLAIPQNMVGRGHYFSLRVKGESMVEDGILDGDYVIVEERNTAQNGDIVVALLENHFATLKRYFKERDHVRLQPANAAMEPFRVRSVKIQGRVVGLLRSYH
ncbi:MAG: transcriptional repressor LexA [Parcubacteria group bacterium]